jgi:phenylpropionate dioxygenase-like ring-hydroxylating dioxygenase large terminal subunit
MATVLLTCFLSAAALQVVAVDDTCPHRGAPLGDGWTTTDKKTGRKCVVCPYHGWAFDSEGKLRDVPSATHGSWPKRPLIGSYAVEERGGFIWLFYGSPSLPAEERPPIPFTPELEDPKWRAGRWESRMSKITCYFEVGTHMVNYCWGWAAMRHAVAVCSI